MIKIKFEEIKPDNSRFDQILYRFRTMADEIISECDDKKSYDSKISKLIIKIVSEFGILKCFEDGISDEKIWSMEEAIKDLLYAHIIIIDLNNTAQKYLNNIKMCDTKKQLIDMINDKKLAKDKCYLKFDII